MNKLIALLSLLALLSVPSSMGAQLHARTEGETGARMMRKRRKAIQKIRQATKHDIGRHRRNLGKGGKGYGILSVSGASSLDGAPKSSYGLVDATGVSSLAGTSKGSYGLVEISAVTGTSKGSYLTACGGGKGSKGVNCALPIDEEKPVVEEGKPPFGMTVPALVCCEVGCECVQICYHLVNVQKLILSVP